MLAPHGDSDPNYDHRKRRQQTSWRDAIDTAADDRGCFEHANFSLPTPLDQPTIRQSQPIIPRWERLTQPAREYGMGRHFSEAEDAIAAFNELRRQAN